MLHRIAPYEPDRIIYNENMKISPDELDFVITKLKSNNRALLSLDEVVEILQKRRKPSSKFVAFTLDDGYKDNLTHATPVFKHHNVPFCIYVTNSFPNRTADLWWYALENLIKKNPVLRLADGTKLPNKDIPSKQKNFLKLRTLVLNSFYKDPLNYFKQLGELDFNLSKETEENCLTWNEIKLLANDRLVTIGGHTMNHYPLSKLKYEEVVEEITESKKELELRLDKKVRHFAFPFGSRSEANHREYEIAAAAGFDSAVTTIHGHIHLSDKCQNLDRIFLFPLQNNFTTLERIMFWNVKTLVSETRKIFESIL